MKVIITHGPHWKEAEKRLFQHLYKILRQKAIELEMERIAQQESLKEPKS
jgi:hypothetical protein